MDLVHDENGRQENGNRRQEAENRRMKTGKRKPAKEDRRLEAASS